MYPVKQSTAITVPVFVHDASGDAVTGLTDGGFTKRISKNGGAFAAMTVTITEMENGWYSVPLSTSHTDTLGALSVTLTHASAKQVNIQLRVHARLPDDLAFPTVSGRSIDVETTGEVGLDLGNVVGTLTQANVGWVDANSRVDVGAVLGTAQTAADLGSLLTDLHNTLIAVGTAQAATASTLQLAAAETFADDEIIGAWVLITGGTTGVGQARIITDYTGSTDTATISPNWTTTPTGTITYIVVAAPPASEEAGGMFDDLNTILTRLGTPSDLGSGASVAGNLVDIEAQTDDIGAAGAGLTAIPWNAAWDAEVESEVNDALVAVHLDHLLAVDYDPATPPGVSTALLNELIESDAGVSRFTANALEQGPGGATAAAIADAVWDEAQADHVAAGSFGLIASEIADILVDTAEIGAAGAGLTAVPWNAAWDAEVESEVNDGLVALGLDHLVSAAVVGADVADNSIMAYLVSSAATADWDTYVNTTDALQAIRDKQTDIETDTADIQGRLPAALVGGRMDSSVGAVAAGAITAAAFAAGAIDDAALASDAEIAIATAVWNRNIDNNGSGGARVMFEAMQAMRNRVAISGATMTVYEDDDATSSWTSTISTAAGNPITESNPA